MTIINLRKLTLFTILVFGTITVNSCKKSTELYAGLIRYSGDLSLDGCGWVIDTESGTFHPTNLSSEFQQDSLKVELNYTALTTMFNCGFGSSLKELEIKEIYK